MRRLKLKAALVPFSLVGALALAGSVGCSTVGDDDGTFGTDPGDGAGGLGQGGGSGGQPSVGGSSSGGQPSVAGTGNGGANNGGAGGECVGVTAEADAGVDIIWVVDGSGSMEEEIDQIETNLNTHFLNIIGASNLSWNLIVVAPRVGFASFSSFSVCVDSPPASASCGDNPPRFRHVHCSVESTDSLASLAYTYNGVAPAFAPTSLVCGLGASWDGKQWKDFVRMDATKVFIEVTDDSSDVTAQAFDNWLLTGAQPAGMFGSAQERKYIFHGIIGMDTNNPGAPCSEAQNHGPRYQELASLTGGLTASICENDWSPIFQDIADSIVTRLSCEYPVPAPPDGQTVDENSVNVLYFPGENGPEETIYRDNTAGCEDGADGWQWNAARDKILLCGATCERIKNDPDGRVEIKFGCDTEDVPN